MNDPVNHPSHYTAGDVECIDAIAAALVGLTGEEAYDTGAAIKYLWRWKKKNGIEDLKKARWYINRLIEKAEPEEDWSEAPGCGRCGVSGYIDHGDGPLGGIEPCGCKE